MAIEHLEVCEEVFVEIAARAERPCDGLDPVIGKRDQEENCSAERTGREPLELLEAARERFGAHAVAGAVGFRKRCKSWRPSSAAGWNETTSKPRASRSATYSGGWYALQRLVPEEFS